MIDEVNMLETSEVEDDVHRVSLIKKILCNLSQITSYGYVVFALLLFLGVLLMVLSQNYSILSTLQAILFVEGRPRRRIVSSIHK